MSERAEDAQRTAPERGMSRANLRRTSARPDTYSYDETHGTKRRKKGPMAAGTSTMRKRKIEFVDDRGGRRRELRQTIRIGAIAVRAIEGQGGKHT